MEEFSDFSQFDDINPLISKFESMLLRGENPFFDVEEYEEIIEHYIMNNVEHAEKVVEHALSQFPWSTSILLKKAVVLSHREEFKEAFDIVRMVKSIDVNNIELYITLSYIYRVQNKYEKSIAALQKALTFKEEVDEVFFDIAEDYSMLENEEKELEYLKKALLHNPMHNDAMDRLFWTYKLSGKNAESVDYFSDFVKHHPLRQMAWEKLGFSYYEMDLYEKSIKAFEYALSIDEMVTCYTGLAQSYWKLGKLDSAIDVLKQSLLAFPYAPNVNSLIGWIYLDMNDHQNAQKHFLNEIYIDSVSSNAWKGLAQVFIFNNDFNNAFDSLNRSFIMDEIDMGSIDQLISLSLEKETSFEKTDDILVRFTEMYPTNQLLWLKYSEFLFYSGFETKAIEVLEKALKIIENPALIYYRMAALFYLKDDETMGHLNLIAAMNIDSKGVETIFEFSEKLYDYEPLVSLLSSLKTNNDTDENS